jgi:hypothetical protein
MPDQVRHDGQKSNAFLNYNTVSQGGGKTKMAPGLPRRASRAPILEICGKRGVAATKVQDASRNSWLPAGALKQKMRRIQAGFIRRA